MDISIPQIIAAILNFIILLLIVKHFWFDKITAIVDSRQNEIINKIEDTDKNQKLALELKEKNELELSNSKKQGKTIVEEYKLKAEKVYEDILKEAHEEADGIIKKSRLEAERQKKNAEEEIKAEAVELAVLVSSRTLEKTIDDLEHRRLIKDFISKVGI
ncbi:MULTISPECIES: F0F1 ATP synthase subunit B [Clostridium]|jgi:F-type H+-transporting ATPase subunit b|uniref:ATP synthase subunit b n=2 Tax=Clostridium TaxID=1485 RepID=A0A7X5PBJ0_CLOSG|nr:MULTISPECIES: F0F1 ATP synthase subunit B [Clostridium]AJD30154.1 ATP synthase F0, B subunit [Clostridium botulinum Prevot_594]AVP62988.1 ATP synthase F0 subunit B [Clostridium botulinum]AKC60919.1 F0F1-type ATP synthase subunit b [Clostridium sporogenes]AKJ88276.1 ATP F0F1 synthase subunit B [Clostridium sporogenes]KCZ70169.1 F0F1-type ATP synthase subunit b [Clostridium sporogenes]